MERSAPRLAAGKQTLTMRLPPMAEAVQMKGEAGLDDAHAHGVAAQGVSGAAGPLPHRATIERLFGRHDVRDVKAQVGGPATEATRQLGADAYATGRSVAFRSEPDLHTAAHEAAHVVQQAGGVQLAGGVGRSGDTYERHADEVADAVVAGRSAEPLLDRFGGGAGGSPAVQKKEAPYDSTSYTIKPMRSGTALADITTELNKEKSAATPTIKSWKATGVTTKSTEELYVIYAIWQLADAKRWGTEVDLVTEVGPGKKGAIQVRFDAAGNAEGTLVASSPPTVAGTFKTTADAITSLKAKFDLTDIKGEKGQTWKLDQLNKLSAALGRLTGEASALSKYTIILTDNTLSADGQSAEGLTTREDKLSPDGLTAIKVREIRFAVGMFDADLKSFVGDSSNAAPASFRTLLHEVAHAQATKAVDDANAAEMTATAATNKAIEAGNTASAKAVASRNTAVVGPSKSPFWNKFKPADQAASKPLLTALDDADTAITAFRKENDATKMAALEAPALAAIATRDTAKAAVPATNPAHAAFKQAIADQDAYLKVVQDLLAKRQAQAAAAGVTAAAKDPTGARSKRLQAFVDFVTTNSIEPVTKYAKDNWPAKPQEFYAEAFTMWRNDPTFFGTYSSKLKTWFDTGQHLK